jgi:hypothetical protein
MVVSIHMFMSNLFENSLHPPLCLFYLLLWIFLYRLIWVLDCETPNIQIVTNSPDDIHNKTAMYAHAQAETHENESDLVNIVAQSAWPPYTNVFLQPWPKGVDDAVNQGIYEDIAPRKSRFGEMWNDHTSDRVSVDETGVEDEGYQMVV